MSQLDIKAEEILNFWFGHVEDTVVPSENRARIWFGEGSDIDNEMRIRFKEVLDAACKGQCNHWMQEPRGRLALIILLDQFSRHIYRSQTKAYSQDEQSLSVCIQGIQKESDHQLSLIERVFFYFPLLHSEQTTYQEQSVRAYQNLSELAFTETRVIYDSFLKFANHHYALIQRFGRFPQRNTILGRTSTKEEQAYIDEMDNE